MEPARADGRGPAGGRERRPVIERVAAELLDCGPLETVEGGRIVELLEATPLAAPRAPGDSLREASSLTDLPPPPVVPRGHEDFPAIFMFHCAFTMPPLWHHYAFNYVPTCRCPL